MTNAAPDILDYLEHQIPAYPFNPKIDGEFVNELLADFHDIDILEQTKAFRWYYHNEPVARLKNVRLGLRRWISNAWTRKED